MKHFWISVCLYSLPDRWWMVHCKVKKEWYRHKTLYFFTFSCLTSLLSLSLLFFLFLGGVNIPEKIFEVCPIHQYRFLLRVFLYAMIKSLLVLPSLHITFFLSLTSPSNNYPNLKFPPSFCKLDTHACYFSTHVCVSSSRKYGGELQKGHLGQHFIW